MKGTKGKRNGWLGLLLALVVVPCVRAVILEGTGNPSYNTNAPTGSLTNSGWQYEGQWSGAFLGTPIAPTFFLAAKHIGGYVGSNMTLNGSSYTTVAYYDDPSTDLRIWQVTQPFPYYAPLYTKTNEVGSACVVIGRGTDRGPVVIVGGVTNGWQWGNTNNIERWGQNTVSEVSTDTVNYAAAQILAAAFERTSNSNECDFSIDDSSGGVFIQDGGSTGTWKLAGINYTVDSPYVSTNADGANSFPAALVDYYHLYIQSGTNWVQYPSHYAQQFYCTRVSARISWINSILDAPPTGNFSASPTKGAAPLSVTFADNSNGPITNRFWDFGDGATTNFAVTTNPTHTYTAGVYSVTLIVSGPGGSSTNSVPNMISVYDPFVWWQLNYFACTNCVQAQPNADPYGKGMSNTNHFLSGFNPTNATAYLHVISIADTNTTDINVIYLGANGDTNYLPGIVSRTNVLEVTAGTASGSYSNNFVSTGLTNILSGGTGTGIVTNMVDPGGATNGAARYYRIKVIAP